MTGIHTECRRCTLPLDTTNITGVCLECKHIDRDARAGYTAPEIPIEEARAAFMAVFRGHYRPTDADNVYMRGACRKCARSRARHDTGCCEFCSRPWRPRPPKRTRTKRRTPAAGTAG
jgi:hypothetical protein